MFSWQGAYNVLVFGVLLLAVSGNGIEEKMMMMSETSVYSAINCRKHSAVLTDFGAVGDGKTLNTKAFQAAIANLSQFSSSGGSQLFVPPGKWLTGSFNLTSHFTLFLHRDAVILAVQVTNTIQLYLI